MRRFLRSGAQLTCVICLALIAGCLLQQPQKVLNVDGFWEVTTGAFNLQWKVVGAELEIKVRAPTTGWVAVGFDPTVMMQDANLILGCYNDVTGQKQFEDDFGNAMTSHLPDTSAGGTDNVTGISATQAGGETEVHFKIPLDSGDARDRPLVEGNTYKFLLAYGSTDDFTMKHSEKTKLMMEL